MFMDNFQAVLLTGVRGNWGTGLMNRHKGRRHIGTKYKIKRKKDRKGS
jgi:hypothetical protein